MSTENAKDIYKEINKCYGQLNSIAKNIDPFQNLKLIISSRWGIYDPDEAKDSLWLGLQDDNNLLHAITIPWNFKAQLLNYLANDLKYELVPMK
jgi:hypothetical protein